jgi:predicted transposase YbfD/YdcC
MSTVDFWALDMVQQETETQLWAFFSDLPDPRVTGRTAHDLFDIVALALCAVMAGAEGWDDIEEWGQARQTWLRQYLTLRNGIPGHDTIRRVFESLAPDVLEERFVAWMQSLCPKLTDKVIAIDGKTIRGSARRGQGLRSLHMVSAYAAEYGLTLGQQACTEKSNEITAIAELLPTLALEGAVVTIDAMGCQTAIAQQIKDLKGDYVLAVKENPPTLAQALKEFFETTGTPGYPHRTVNESPTLDKGHGRLEERHCRATDELDWLDPLKLRERWAGLKSVACIESERTREGKTSIEKRYLSSSLPADAARLLYVSRAHWGVENGLHGCLDVTFGEDASPIQLRNAAQNFSFLRRIALNLFRADTSKKLSLPKKRKVAAWNSEFLVQVLGMSSI